MSKPKFASNKGKSWLYLNVRSLNVASLTAGKAAVLCSGPGSLAPCPSPGHQGRLSPGGRRLCPMALSTHRAVLVVKTVLRGRICQSFFWEPALCLMKVKESARDWNARPSQCLAFPWRVRACCCPGKCVVAGAEWSHGESAGCSLWSTPLQYSCLENPRDRGA